MSRRTALPAVLRQVQDQAAGATLSDRELLERFARDADQESFTVLVHRHAPMVLGVCRRALGNGQDAEDACQATFLVLAKKAASVRWTESVANWLFLTARRVAHNARLAAARRARRERRGPSAAPAPNPLDDISGRELLGILDEELAKLADRYRAPLVLCYLEGLTRDEAASHLGVPLATLKSQLERGRERLHASLQKRGVTLGAGLLAVATAALAPAMPELSRLCAAKLGEPVSPAVAALVRGALSAQGRVSAVFLAAGVVGVLGLAVAAGSGPAEKAKPPGPAAASSEPSTATPAERAAADSVPLPDGALVRLGSMRLRHACLSNYVFLDGGKTIVTTGSDRVVRTWDAATGRQTRAVRLRGEADPGRCDTLAPDAKTLVTLDKGSLIFWDTESGKQIKKVMTSEKVDGLAFSPDGKTLAVLESNNQTVTLLDWQTGQQRKVALPVRQGPGGQFARGVAFHGFSPDGKWFVAQYSNEPLRVFEAATGRNIYCFDYDALSATVSHDGKRLAILSSQDEQGTRPVVRLFDLESGKEVGQFSQEPESTVWSSCFNLSHCSLAFSPDDKTIAYALPDGGGVLDSVTGRVLYRLSGQPRSLSFAPDGQTLAARGEHHLRLWRAATGEERSDHRRNFGNRLAAAVSPDGGLLAAVAWADRAVNVWDLPTGTLVRQLPIKEEARFILKLAFSADGTTLTAGALKGRFQVWDVATGKELRTGQLDNSGRPDNEQTSSFVDLQLSGDGKQVRTLEMVFDRGETMQVGIWDALTGKRLRNHSFPGNPESGCWLADGALVALPFRTGVTVIETRTGTPLYRVEGTNVGQIVSSPDGQLVAAVREPRNREADKKAEPGRVVIWEGVTGKQVASIATGWVGQFALAPGNRTLVTTDRKCLRVWDLATGQERLRLPLPETATDSSGKIAAHRLLVLPDGRRAFTALPDGTGLVWDLTPAARGAALLVKEVSEKELAAWWADLASEDASRAYAAVWRLAEVPEQAAPFLRQYLKPVAEPDAIKTLVGQLDSASFRVREKAFKQLEDMGAAATPVLRKVLDDGPSPEVYHRLEALLARSPYPVLSPETLRQLRAIQVVEQMAPAEARPWLEELARGAAHAPETREAQAALQRLRRDDRAP